MRMLFPEPTFKRLEKTARIQYAFITMNEKVVVARTHFRARLSSPFVLFYYKESFRKNGIRQIVRQMTYTMV
jgi:hypothetical protein